MDGIVDPRISAVSLQRIALFRDLADDELRLLAARLRLIRAPRGTVLLRQGEPADALYIVETGQIGVVSGTGPQRRVLSTLGPGTPIGDLALLAGGPTPATFEVIIDAQVLALSRADFDLALRRQPALAINLCRALAQRLRTLEGQRAGSGRDAGNRIVAVVGGLEETVLLARSAAEQSGRHVLVLEVVDSGDENSTIDPSDPFHDISALGAGADRLETPVELSSGDFSEVVSRLLLRYEHLLVRLPEGHAGSPRLKEILDLCDVTITYGRRAASWFSTIAPADKQWTLGTATEAPYDRGRLDRERARTARRLTGRMVGLALSSGASHGLAHIGVLRVLEEEKVPIDLLAGTSMGSVIGSAFVAGHDAAALYRLGREFAAMASLRTGWRFWDFTLPRSGLIRGRRAEQWLAGWTGGKRFEDVEIPFFIVAAEVVGGRAVVFSQGPLAAAARASFSMPGLFEPVPHGRDFLVDGGSVDPVPCRPLADAGASIIIASNTIPQIPDRLYRPIRRRVRPGRSPSIMEISQSQREVMEAGIALLRMDPYDVLIAPRVGMYSALEAQRIDTFVRRGEEAARAAMPRIRELLSPNARVGAAATPSGREGSRRDQDESQHDHQPSRT
jgi:NTE family protein